MRLARRRPGRRSPCNRTRAILELARAAPPGQAAGLPEDVAIAAPETLATREPEPASPPAAGPLDSGNAPQPAPGPRPAIVAEGLTRRFDDVTAVQDISFSVPAGSIFGIIGPSGSGKTTTLRMVMGSIAPSSGSVQVLGDDPVAFSTATRERIGYMPQQFVLYPDLTAGENVDFVASLFGLLVFRRRRRVRHVLRLLELWDARKRRARDLSGGMQRRLELACAMVHEPRVLILDEPTAGLDPLLRQAVWEELHRLRGTGVSIVVTTQYVGETEECDEVALISESRLVALATPEGLRRLAFGGDLLEITTNSTFDAATLAPIPSIVSIRQTGLREIRAVVDDAATDLPQLVDAITAAGGEIATAREARPSFDEVFAELVARDRKERDAAARSPEAAPGASPAAEAAPAEPAAPGPMPTAEPAAATLGEVAPAEPLLADEPAAPAAPHPEAVARGDAVPPEPDPVAAPDQQLAEDPRADR